MEGMLFAGGLAFVFLLLTTCNFLVSLYALLVIASILSNIFAIVNQLGWEFGVIESVSLVMSIGFSGEPILMCS